MGALAFARENAGECEGMNGFVLPKPFVLPGERFGEKRPPDNCGVTV
jgi:hypothetical protein